MELCPPPFFSKILKPLRDLVHHEAAGGLFLMVAGVLALIIANSPFAVHYSALLDLPFEVRVGTFGISKPILLWINDGLMAVFFFLVGMELKREIIEGHLSTPQRASLPGFAAMGGMVAPAAIYTAFNWGDPVAMRGWAIPTATDIVFALGVLSMLGRRVPASLKVFLMSVAVFDDLGAIVVIALFYTAKLSLLSLAIAVFLILCLACLNRFGVTMPSAYLIVGLLLWVVVLKSGVHATLAGVVLAMFIPLRMPADPPSSHPTESLLRNLEHLLHPWVTFAILPVFAFANAGIPVVGLSVTDSLHPVPFGIMIGLFIGKQFGVLTMSFLAVRLGIATLPEGVDWLEFYGTTLLCGIGFTMSLFIASLAFEQGAAGYLGLERLGVIVGSFASGVCGYAVLRLAIGNRTGT